MITHLPPWVYGTIYALLVPVFGHLYYFYQEADNGFGKALGYLEAHYFSTITITTLGYGDISPETDTMRALAATEVILGIFTIGLFLSALSHSRSTQLAEEDAKRQENILHRNAQTGIRKHTLLITPLTDFYLFIGAQISHSERNSSTPFSANFDISMLSKLFDLPFLANRPIQKPYVEFYYESLRELNTEFERLLISVDLSNYPEVEKKITTWISYYKKYDFSEAMMEKTKIGVGDKINAKKMSLIEKEKEFLRDPNLEIKITGGHVLNPYIALYLQIHKLYPLTQELDKELKNISFGSRK